MGMIKLFSHCQDASFAALSGIAQIVSGYCGGAGPYPVCPVWVKVRRVRTPCGKRTYGPWLPGDGRPMPARRSVGPAGFGAAFTALLAAAGFTVDGVLGALPEDCRRRVSRSTLYDWKKGQHLPLDATGPLLEVVRVCLAAAGERGGTLGVSAGSEDGWRRLLAEAKLARDADIARGRRTSGGEPGSAWSGGPASERDPVKVGVHQAVGGGPAPGWGVFDEAELLLPYGIVSQLTASARGGLLAADLSDRVDPLAVGADLLMWLGQCCRGRQLALVLVDDLHWADGPSARGRRGRGPAARGVAGPRPGPRPGRGRRGRYPASAIVLRRGPGPRGHRMRRAGGRGRAPAAMRHRALGVLAIGLYAAGRGPEGLARLTFLPAAPSEVPREDTDTLVLARHGQEPGRGPDRSDRRLAPRAGPAGAAGPGPAGDLRRPPAARRRRSRRPSPGCAPPGSA